MRDYRRIGRKITATLFIAQCLGSAGFITAATINPLAGAELTGHPSWAGVPTAFWLLGSAFAAFGWGYGMDVLGRRGGLTLGLILGVVGASIAGLAVIGGAFIPFIMGLALMGGTHAALQLSRFASAEVHPPQHRGRAISNVVIGGTAGAVLGPLLVGPMGRWAQSFGFPELSGPYAATLVLFAIGSVVVFALLRPDPRDIGRELARLYPETTRHHGPTRSISRILRQPAAIVAVAAMVIGQVVMVMLMVITSLHMHHHHHELTSIAMVISSHTFGMYAFSIISGQLADRWGRGPVILIGALTLILASLSAPLSPNVLPIAVALFLLGLGWNFCFVGGSALLADQLSPAERAKTQGANDFLIGMASAAGSLGSGVIFAALGYGAMGLVAAVITLVPLALVVWWEVTRRRSVSAVA